MDITFGDLMNCDVGEVFTAESNPEGYDWVNSSAKVLAKDGADVILKVTEVNCTDGKFSSVKRTFQIPLDGQPRKAHETIYYKKGLPYVWGQIKNIFKC